MKRGFVAALCLGWIVIVALSVDMAAQSKKGGDPKLAAMKNPVAYSDASATKGRQVYGKACRHCHGLRGKGDGPLAPKNPSPADLTDDQWIYGSSDGEIYNVIANGVGGNSEMKGLRSELTTNDMWNVVNFIRSIGPKKP